MDDSSISSPSESRRSAAAVVIGVLFAVTAAVNLQYPLYATYMDAAGFGFGLRTATFAVYVLGIIPVMALCGGASDAIGRKVPLAAALGAAVGATGLMMVAPTAHALVGARLLQGISVGLSFGAGAAYLAEWLGDARRAAWWTALATSLGFGGGALLTGLVSSPGMLHPISYPIVLALTLAGLIALFALPARPVATPGASWLRLPTYPVGTVAYSIGNLLTWSVSGILLALIPHLLRADGHQSWAGLALFLVCGSGAAVQVVPALAPRSPPIGAVTGLACSGAGYLLLLAGAWFGQPVLLVLAAMAAGASGFGFMYLAGLTAVSLAGGQRRSAAVSGFMLLGYVGFGGPCILIGVLADRLDPSLALLAGTVPMLGALGWLATRLLRRPLAVAPQA